MDLNYLNFPSHALYPPIHQTWDLLAAAYFPTLFTHLRVGCLDFEGGHGFWVGGIFLAFAHTMGLDTHHYFTHIHFLDHPHFPLIREVYELLDDEMAFCVAGDVGLHQAFQILFYFSSDAQHIVQTWAAWHNWVLGYAQRWGLRIDGYCCFIHQLYQLFRVLSQLADLCPSFLVLPQGLQWQTQKDGWAILEDVNNGVEDLLLSVKDQIEVVVLELFLQLQSFWVLSEVQE